MNTNTLKATVLWIFFIGEGFCLIMLVSMSMAGGYDTAQTASVFGLLFPLMASVLVLMLKGVNRKARREKVTETYAVMAIGLKALLGLANAFFIWAGGTGTVMRYEAALFWIIGLQTCYGAGVTYLIEDLFR